MAGQLLIIEPKPIAVLAGPAGAGLQNMLTPDPKEVFTAGVIAAHDFNIDLGSAQSVDSFFLGFTPVAGTGTVQILSGTGLGTDLTTQAGPLTIRAADCQTARSSRLVRLAAPVTSRYWTFRTDNYAAPFQAGIIAVGLAFAPAWDREWGSGRRPIDTAKVTPLISGGFGVQPGARKAAYSWTFGDLTDTETEAMWSIFLRTGIGSPLIVAERDGATVGFNEQLHYGLFQRLDSFERRAHNETKWALEIEEWI